MTTGNNKPEATYTDERRESVRQAATEGARRAVERTTGAPVARAPQFTEKQLAQQKRAGEIATRLEELTAVPEADLTQEQAQEMIDLADEAAQLAGAHVEVGEVWWKPQEHEVAIVTLEGIEIREDQLNGGSQRTYRVIKAGESVLVGESWALQSLARYAKGQRVIIRSLGKVAIGNAKEKHDFQIVPPPTSAKAQLPVLYVWPGHVENAPRSNKNTARGNVAPRGNNTNTRTPQNTRQDDNQGGAPDSEDIPF